MIGVTCVKHERDERRIGLFVEGFDLADLRSVLPPMIVISGCNAGALSIPASGIQRVDLTLELIAISSRSAAENHVFCAQRRSAASPRFIDRGRGDPGHLVVPLVRKEDMDTEKCEGGLLDAAARRFGGGEL